MSLFARIEEACGSFIEHAFARTFPTDLEPAHIGRKLVATMEARSVHDADSASAPSHYIVRVSSGDFDRLRPHQLYLEEQWAALLEDVASRVNVRFDSAVQVRLVEDDALVTGAIQIDTEVEAYDLAPQTPAEPKIFTMRMIKGMPVDARYEIGDAVAIGRGRENDIVLADPRVSRRHARIECDRRSAILVDLGSTNGTIVDGKRASGRVRLHDGSVITLGNTSLRFEEGSA